MTSRKTNNSCDFWIPCLNWEADLQTSACPKRPPHDRLLLPNEAPHLSQARRGTVLGSFGHNLLSIYSDAQWISMGKKENHGKPVFWLVDFEGEPSPKKGEIGHYSATEYKVLRQTLVDFSNA